MATVGENIRRYRLERSWSVVKLANEVGMTEGAIRHYENGIRTPGEEQMDKMAKALDVSPEMLEDHRIRTARDLVGTLLQLEEEFGIVPDEHGDGLRIDRKAESAQKTAAALHAWRGMRRQLIAGEITREEYEAWKRKF